jgi:hypothetical protein
MRVLVASAFVAITILACSSTTTLPPSDGAIALGTWGGDTAGMIVGDTALHLHVGCTFGDVSGRVPVNAAGQFDVRGSYMLRAYPIAIGPAVPARFTGRIDGATATVTVTVDDTVQKKTVILGPVSVEYKREPRMRNCPICRRPDLVRSP